MTRRRRPGFTLDRVERFDPFPRWVLTWPMLELIARKQA
jgi:hypothetical protein